ncbi:MAG: TlyA family RNA methyltransferase [Pseudomonadota bacterium]|nr:TlyA family RNA methyltransferase [Pseudomonadota bacterium]
MRLDVLLVERRLAPSREKARAMIMTGAVLADEKRLDKAGIMVDRRVELRIRGGAEPYVSRGGRKLKGALDALAISVRDRVVIDVGASTGGFTDCLLQEGAKKVYALDVGYGQLAWRLRQDPRVVPIERVNIRYYDGRDFSETVDMATVDASFISLKLVLPAVCPLIGGDGAILALIKPQFEVGKGLVGKNGVVADPVLHQRVIDDLASFVQTLGLTVLGTCASPLPGPAGNREFFIYAAKRP